jgi:tellurite resistance protein TehA-like permease
MLVAVALGLVLVVVAPPLVLILLVAFGIFAFREEKRASGNHLPLAIFAGLALIACFVLGSLLVHR